MNYFSKSATGCGDVVNWFWGLKWNRMRVLWVIVHIALSWRVFLKSFTVWFFKLVHISHFSLISSTIRIILLCMWFLELFRCDLFVLCSSLILIPNRSWLIQDWSIESVLVISYYKLQQMQLQKFLRNKLVRYVEYKIA